MIQRIKETLDALAGRLGYPGPVRELINRGPFSTNICCGSGGIISSGCELRGDISIRDAARIGPNCTLHGQVTIGRGTNLVEDVRVVGNVEFGRYCAIADETLFQQINHPMSNPAIQRRFYNRLFDTELGHGDTAPISLGSDVWVGSRAIVLEGVDVGHGAVIGAGSIVTDDVEPYAIVAGIPTERRGWRFSEEVRDRLLDLEWWEWGEERIRKHPEFFNREVAAASEVPDP